MADPLPRDNVIFAPASPTRWGVLLFALALAVRVGVALAWSFDGLYGQDAFAYFNQGIAIATALPRGQPPPTDFFWPNGYPLLIALSSYVIGPTALAGQLPSLLLGATLSPLAYALCRRLFETHLFETQGHPAGLVAGLILAVAGQPILSSISAMSDMPALFWAALAVWAVVRSQKAVVSSQTAVVRRQTTDRRPQTADGSPQSLVLSLQSPVLSLQSPVFSLQSSVWLLAAGGALGLAAITRWLYGLLIPAIVIYVLLTTHDRRQAIIRLVYIGVGGALVVLPQLWLSLDRPDALYHHWLAGWSPLNAFQNRFQTSDGVQTYRWPVAIFNLLPFFHPAYLFPTFGLAAVWGTWRLWRRRAWAALTLLLGWAGAGYLFLAGIPYENFRYGLIHYYPVVLLAGYGVSEASVSLGQGGQRWRRMVFTPLVVVSVLGMLAWAYPMLTQFIQTQNASKGIARQVAQAVPPDATLLSLGLTATLDHYTPLRVVEFFHETPTTLAGRVCQGEPVYLLLDLPAFDSQWTGYPVQTALTWLRQTPGLDPIGQFGSYTLFKVGQRCT